MAWPLPLSSPRPDRFARFGTLAMHDPVTPEAKPEGCAHAGTVASMINRHANGEYPDADRLLPFCEKAAVWGMPVYIHPAPPIKEPAVTRGDPGLVGPIRGWSHEIGGHALRLVFSGLFGRVPDQHGDAAPHGGTAPLPPPAERQPAQDLTGPKTLQRVQPAHPVAGPQHIARPGPDPGGAGPGIHRCDRAENRPVP
ncbi:putative metal-dependent hydrolase of the TIM-barrel fold protein [Marinibacterium anthonyi]|nr:putative metal-dependent hydrolase of the TIM-barrel fold protein [Marinibacterium anthonyi]